MKQHITIANLNNNELVNITSVVTSTNALALAVVIVVVVVLAYNNQLDYDLIPWIHPKKRP